MAERLAQIQRQFADQQYQISFRHLAPSVDAAASVFFMGGFLSNMAGSKAEFLAQQCAESGLGYTRFDYHGHGVSEGDAVEGSISQWLDDSLAVFRQCANGPQIIIGSSMGGWLALLLNRALQKDPSPNAAVKGIALIAPAVDMTKDLMLDTMSESEAALLAAEDRFARGSDYGDPYILTRAFLEDGLKHNLFGSDLRVGAPVHILQGGLDKPVPVAHAQKLMSHLLMDEAKLTLIPDGDHSLSREQDLDMLWRAVQHLIDLE